MTNDDRGSLGGLVQGLREAKGMTQEQLGKNAGYGAGAGVSISRFENGQLRPSPDKLQGIAEALGITREELESEATKLAAAEGGEHGAGRGTERLKERDERIKREVAERVEALSAVSAAFDEAWNRARTDFLERFAEIAERIGGAQPPERPQSSKGAKLELTTDAAAHRQEEAAAGFAATLVDSAATTLLLNALRGGPFAGGIAGGTRALGIGALALPAILLGVNAAFSLVRTSRRQQQERAEELDRVEAELAATEAGLSALMSLLPRATEILDYIAVHAGHALDRWERQVGALQLAWDDLDRDARERYVDFIQISGAEIVVQMIDFQKLSSTADSDDLARQVAKADLDLTHSRDVVTSRV